MLKINDFLKELDRLAPLELSEQWIKNGGYDNSGLLVQCTENASNVLFSLDLSEESVALAKKLKCDTIVTHHPAIYKPITSIKISDANTRNLAQAIKSNLNVISMHINLDMAEEGIDAQLSLGLGAKKVEILSPIDKKYGYGRLGEITPISFAEFVKRAKETFESDKIIAYGKKKEEIKTFASFCGAGGNEALELACAKNLKCDVIVTSDISHHAIKGLVEQGYKLMVLTHYSAEEFGFRKFYEKMTDLLKDNVITHYFSDKRFK